MASNNNPERKGFTITWIIENFKYSTQTYEGYYATRTFIVDTMEKTKWSLIIYFSCDNKDMEDRIFFGLRRMADSKGPPSIKIDCECALITADGHVARQYNLIEKEVSKNDHVIFRFFNEMYGTSAEKHENFFPNGNLTVRFKMWKYFGEIKNDGYCTARTHIGVGKKCSIWSIRNFSTLKKGNELKYTIKSTINDKSIVKLKLSVTGEDEPLQISFISTVSKIEPRCSFSIRFSILDLNGDDVTCGEAEFFFNTLVKESKCLLTLTKKQIMRKKRQYLRDDVLSLLCECNFSTGLVYEEIENINYGWIPPQTANACFPNLKLAENTATANPNAHSVLKKDIELMLHDKVLSDVKLRTGAETFPAHWFILSARSPVFRAMFESDMKEKAQDCIHIEDVDADAVRRLLLYMYTDACEDLQWESASQLYAAADKYQILSLKDECSSFLKANLDTANACEALMIADLHHDEHLKSATSEFILKHDKEIFNSDEWKRLIETNGKLAFETMLLKFKD